MKRDPRRDPKAGDALRKNGKRREVAAIRRYKAQDWYKRVRVVGPMASFSLYLTSWRKWAKDAEVISRGE